MKHLDWIMIVLWVVGTSAFGAYFQRYVKSTRDYLLAGKRLRWWQIAAAQSADAVDAGDFVATTGQGYRTGLTQLGFVWWGMGIGSVLLSRYLVPLLYRTGVYTNAEYLQLRYNGSLRLASVVLQILYRFVAMAMVVYAMAKMFNVIVNVELWYAIWAAMALTLVYVFAAGQLGIVMAAIPQVLLMLFTALFVFGGAAREIGGWEGFSRHTAELGGMLHLAGHVEQGVPNGVYLWGLILTLLTYPIVNQTVAQRIVAARSEADARKGTIASLLPWCIITGISVALGIMAVVLVPDVVSKDPERVFPVFMQRYLPEGVLGLGVAALMVASMSTGAGIGTAIAGLMTVDVCGSWFRGPRADRHRLLATRVFAAVSIVCGTLCAMLIPYFGGMIPFYTALTGTFFLPLTVPYLGGALYPRASRGAGMAALVGGVGVGVVLFCLGEPLPPILWHAQWRPFWVFAAAWIAFFVWSLIENRIRGPIPDTELAAILNSSQLGKPATAEQVREMVESPPIAPWPAQKNLDYETTGIPADVRWYAHPTTWELAAVVGMIVLMYWWW